MTQIWNVSLSWSRLSTKFKELINFNTRSETRSWHNIYLCFLTRGIMHILQVPLTEKFISLKHFFLTGVFLFSYLLIVDFYITSLGRHFPSGFIIHHQSVWKFSKKINKKQVFNFDGKHCRSSWGCMLVTVVVLYFICLWVLMIFLSYITAKYLIVNSWTLIHRVYVHVGQE